MHTFSSSVYGVDSGSVHIVAPHLPVLRVLQPELALQNA
jgi:hypothetical protein